MMQHAQFAQARYEPEELLDACVGSAILRCKQHDAYIQVHALPCTIAYDSCHSYEKNIYVDFHYETNIQIYFFFDYFLAAANESDMHCRNLDTAQFFRNKRQTFTVF